MNIRILLGLMIFFPVAATAKMSISDTITLNVTIPNAAPSITLLNSEITDNNYRKLKWMQDSSDGVGQVGKFDPIFYQIRTTSPTAVSNYTFHVSNKYLNCVSNSSENIVDSLQLSIGDVNEASGKLMLSGDYWHQVTIPDGTTHHISEVMLKINFPWMNMVDQRQHWDCFGNIVLLVASEL
ncbi:hypothetical protein HWQ46_26675 [Shewanella sp. D64]|uniref:hypothetical protein n=1 Tax=unclassified Shewanella TaxID=196818 RepID=UPI0022BA4D2E|nr:MULTISPECIES: hypothetical protein [unclassified Shewanella]MEC4729094.1 hypothetical protein [Shewanella sp. D64]MEC4740886.1 hypothetical protein [Shewanella sp. E94]WBJ94793.1 hypothetical protein HWQ47_23565 [Shewanella sp. MTB7]WBJ97156.1 hypothetical protein HWQ47_08670 [Shewanella sp. MTB7]